MCLSAWPLKINMLVETYVNWYVFHWWLEGQIRTPNMGTMLWLVKEKSILKHGIFGYSAFRETSLGYLVLQKDVGHQPIKTLVNTFVPSCCCFIYVCLYRFLSVETQDSRLSCAPPHYPFLCPALSSLSLGSFHGNNYRGACPPSKMCGFPDMFSSNHSKASHTLKKGTPGTPTETPHFLETKTMNFLFRKNRKLGAPYHNLL